VTAANGVQWYAVIGGVDGHKRFAVVEMSEARGYPASAGVPKRYRIACECGWSTRLDAPARSLSDAFGVMFAADVARARAQHAAHVDLARLGVR
jgi:hypothetical protein